MKFIVAFFFSACMVFSARADESPILYSRDKISIVRMNLKPDTSLMPWQQQEAKEKNKLVFDVDIRDGRTLYQQEGWFNLTSYAENSGVMMMFAQEARAPIIYSAQYAPVDILFIDRAGNITQILPSIELAQLEQEIIPDSPVRAFLFIKSGMCEKLIINPGDRVEYSLFKKPPTILSAPGAKPAMLVTPMPNATIQFAPPPKAAEEGLMPDEEEVQ